MNTPQSSGCGKCGGSTWLLRDDGSGADPCSCQKLTIKRNKARRLFTTLPKFYAENAGLDRNPVVDLEPGLLRRLRAYARKLEQHLDEGRGLWFTGPQGTGKTSAAVAIAREALERHKRSVSFQSVPMLLSRIRQTYNDDAMVDYITFFKQLQSIDLLVLDDVGAQNDTSWVLEQFYILVNERMLGKRATIITTNLSSEQLYPQVGKAVVSRLLEICGEPIEFTGFDWRIQKAREATIALDADAAELPRHTPAGVVN